MCFHGKRESPARIKLGNLVPSDPSSLLPHIRDVLGHIQGRRGHGHNQSVLRESWARKTILGGDPSWHQGVTIWLLSVPTGVVQPQAQPWKEVDRWLPAMFAFLLFLLLLLPLLTPYIGKCRISQWLCLRRTWTLRRFGNSRGGDEHLPSSPL